MTALASEPMPMLKHRRSPARVLGGPCKCPCTAGTELREPTRPWGPAHQCCLATAHTATACRARRQPTGLGGRQEMGCQDLQEVKRWTPHPALRICFTHSRVHGKDPLGTHTFPTRTWKRDQSLPTSESHGKGYREEWRSVTRCTWLPRTRPPPPETSQPSWRC